jgi:flagellar hook-associated protein 1
MSDLLNIGRSGVMAYRTALSTVGENVSNSETEGYTRRRVALNESATSTANSVVYKSSSVFGGVEVGSVQRVFDNYRATFARFANSEYQKADAKATWLSTAEGALDDSNVGLGVKITAVFTAGEGLSADVQSDTNRRTMLTAVVDTVNQFTQTGAALRNVSDGITSNAQNIVDKLNGNLAALAKINASLSKSSQGTAGRALLEDQRDATLMEISNAVGIDTRIEQDGRATVTLLGDQTVVLVDAQKNNPGYVGMSLAANGRFSLVSSGFGTEQAMSPQSGSLAGLVDAANQVAARRDSLDAIAAKFVDTINTWNEAGIDRNNDPGAALLSGSTAEGLAVTTDDLSKIAAKSTGGVNNGNALALSGYRDAAGPEAQWALLVSTHAQSVSSAKAEQSATSSQRDGALQQLDQVTGIDLDVEAAQLLRFQQAYNASARIISVARETLQEILGLFN